MRLNAFTLIEGIVSMVLLSILLSVAVIVSFNLYRSLPSQGLILRQSLLQQEIDSLVQLRITESRGYSTRGYLVVYSTADFYDFERVKIATCTMTDSLDRELTTQRIFYTLPNEEE